MKSLTLNQILKKAGITSEELSIAINNTAEPMAIFSPIRIRIVKCGKCETPVTLHQVDLNTIIQENHKFYCKKCDLGKVQSWFVLLKDTDFLGFTLKIHQHGPNVLDRDNVSPLEACSALGNEYIPHMEFLLDQGANPNGYKNTLLFNAVDRRSAEMLELLLEAGADVTVSNGDYKTLLHFTVAHNNVELSSILLKYASKKLDTLKEIFTTQDYWNQTVVDVAEKECNDLIEVYNQILEDNK